MISSTNKILITGDTSEIGLGFTERFIHDDNTAIICGRRPDETVSTSHFVETSYPLLR